MLLAEVMEFVRRRSAEDQALLIHEVNNYLSILYMKCEGLPDDLQADWFAQLDRLKMMLQHQSGLVRAILKNESVDLHAAIEVAINAQFHLMQKYRIEMILSPSDMDQWQGQPPHFEAKVLVPALYDILSWLRERKGRTGEWQKLNIECLKFGDSIELRFRLFVEGQSQVEKSSSEEWVKMALEQIRHLGFKSEIHTKQGVEVVLRRKG